MIRSLAWLSVILMGCASVGREGPSIGNLPLSFKEPAHLSAHRTPASPDGKIHFSSGALDPVKYKTKASDLKTYRAAANKRAKERGITRDDCFSEDSNGYSRFCDILKSEESLKRLVPGDPLLALSAEEMAALKWYAEFGYESYNAALWSGDQAELDSHELDIKLTISGLNKLPPHEETTVRCDHAVQAASAQTPEIEKIASRYTEGGTFRVKGFWSTSIGADPLYQGTWLKKCRVQLSVRLKKTGRLIEALSTRPYEQEVLVLPMTEFKVLKKEKSQKDGLPFYSVEVEAL